MLIRVVRPLAAATLVLSMTLAPALAADVPVGPVQWEPVTKTDNVEVFVDPASIHAAGTGLEVTVKQNYAQPQPAAKKGKSYLSTGNVYRIDCAQRRLGLKDLRAYDGLDLQGKLVQKATAKDKNMQWLDAPERTVFGEIVDFVCRPPGG
jgi:hypothetical protein